MANKRSSTECCVPACCETVYRVTKLVDKTTICNFFGGLVENESTESVSAMDGEGLGLCKEHYGVWYRHTHPFQTKCKTCEKNMSDMSKSRACPQPIVIQKYLQENTDFSGYISNEDRVCYACYRSHLVTIKHLNNTVHSTDSDLHSLLDKIQRDTPVFSDINTVDQAVQYASNKVAIQVGEALLKQTALLLPSIYQEFCDKLKKITRLRDIAINQDIQTLASPTWLRSELSLLLEHHLAYRCSVKRYGTVLYRYGGDLLHALNVSLGSSRANSDGASTQDEFQNSLTRTCLALNAKLNAHIKKCLKQHYTIPQNIEDIDIEQCIRELDPDIWKAICLLTQPISPEAIKRADKSHVRKMRRFFCVCSMLYTTSSQCSFPLHVFLTDAIETCGGSPRLTRLLNRLGVCASKETHDCYVQYRVEKSKKEGPMSGFPDNAFMLVSADNLDYIHSYARIYCGNQQSSWHGTTVQLVQPQPSTLVEVPVHQPEESRESPSTTHAHVTTNVSTQDESIRHPTNPPSPTLETVLHTHLSKRRYSMQSPLNSPGKHSPLPKRCRRMRTGTEGKDSSATSSSPSPSSTSCMPNNNITRQQLPTLTIANFRLNEEEAKSMLELREICNKYMLQKVASNTHTETLIDLQTYFNLYTNQPPPEISNIIYYKVLSQRCDDKETLLNIINDLYQEFVVNNKKKWILLEGDQATYERLQSIKTEYGNDLSWLIPFPGDWHMLKNFQEVLIKIYFDAGLIELAAASGYQPNSIGSNFKRTHNFLLEVWESMYRHFLSGFLSTEAPGYFQEYVSDWIKSFPESMDQESAHRNLKEMLCDLSDKYKDFQEDFMEYVDEESSKDKTKKFWSQFVFEDCYAYVSLFLAIRSGRWDLRNGAIKSMAALFTAFDRPKYQKLIPQHTVDMLTIPEEVLANLKRGGFTVSIRGRPCHSVGVDEAHEMCINRECKEYITRPSADYINRTAIFLPVRAKAIKNVEKQVFSDTKSANSACPKSITSLRGTGLAKKFEMNVRSQIQSLKSSSINASNTGSSTLQHLFKKKELSPDQIHDLVNFREIGQAEFERRVQYFVLRTPSVKTPKRLKRLLTFTERRARQKKVSDIEKERRIQIECWKKRVAYATSTGTQLETAYEQCIELPRAIATSDGNPTKGTKSNTTKAFEKRYENATPQIVTTALPIGWVPDTTIVEGMFLINITPWSAHKNIGDYAEFLLKQHIIPHFRNGSNEVHLLFDDPECQVQSPKYFERQRRDQLNPVSSNHHCTDFTKDLIIPPKWRETVLNCRKYKRNLVCFLSQFFLEAIKNRLNPNQRFVTAGGLDGTLRNKAMSVTQRHTPQCEPQLTCNAEESDTRIWLHVLNSNGQKKLVLSPDTDVYHIGLPFVFQTSLEVMVKLSPFTSLEHRYLDVQALLTAFANDPDLALIPQSHSLSVLQMLYVCTGCDFISFFHGLGKSTFLATLFEYSEFITSNTAQAPGTLADTDPTSNGVLSFFRLVGCAYFRKHKTVFLPAYPTPMSLFNSLKKDGQTHLAHHSAWLSFLRDRVWSKISYEVDMIPSDDALLRHWKRSCWVISVWRQSTQNHITYPPLDRNGWKVDQNVLLIEWDSDENITKVRTRVALIKKGCACKTGCLTGRCKCKKSNSPCGPGCKCLSCCNMPKGVSPGQSQVEEEDNVESDNDSEDGDDLTEEVDDVMNNVFGNDHDSDSANMDDASSDEANFDNDMNTGEENMDIDITW